MNKLNHSAFNQAINAAMANAFSTSSAFSSGGYSNTSTPAASGGMLGLLNALFSEFGPDAIDVAKRLSESKFATWQERPDAEHWETLHPYIKRVARLYQAKLANEDMNTVFKEVNVDELNEQAGFMIYMLEAFDNGERFIVAKLAYGGEA